MCVSWLEQTEKVYLEAVYGGRFGSPSQDAA